jgi:hypothetical protein
MRNELILLTAVRIPNAVQMHTGQHRGLSLLEGVAHKFAEHFLPAGVLIAAVLLARQLNIALRTGIIHKHMSPRRREERS